MSEKADFFRVLAKMPLKAIKAWLALAVLAAMAEPLVQHPWEQVINRKILPKNFLFYLLYIGMAIL